MDTKKLISFTAVMKYHNLADASAAIYMSESAISKHICALEKEFGSQLFVRKTHGLYPTEAAYAFDKYATRVLCSYQQITEDLSELRARDSNVLTLATTSVMSEYGLTKYASMFMRKYPKIRCRSVEAEGADIPRILIEGRAKAALTAKSLIDPSEFDTLPILDDRLAVVLPANHKLASAKTISIDQLKHEGFIVPGEKSSPYFLLLNLCRKHDFEPRIVYSTTRYNSLFDFVGYGFGISLITKTVAQKLTTANTKVVPLTEKISDTIVLTRLKNAVPQKSVDLLWNFMTSYFC